MKDNTKTDSDGKWFKRMAEAEDNYSIGLMYLVSPCSNCGFMLGFFNQCTNPECEDFMTAADAVQKFMPEYEKFVRSQRKMHEEIKAKEAKNED